MRIISIEVLRDGGTIRLVTDEDEWCIDGRIASKTRGKLFRNYPAPDNSNQSSDEALITPILVRALKLYSESNPGKLVDYVISQLES